jgi:hypothetical protein
MPPVGKEVSGWGVSRWISVWLALPRSGKYAPVAQVWDAAFSQIKAFRQLAESGERPISLAEMLEQRGRTLYVVPYPLDQATLFARKAVAVLRAKGEFLVQGIPREAGYLASAGFVATTTSEFLQGYFRSSFTNLVEIESVARRLIEKEQAAGHLFATSDRVHLIRLGSSAAPVVRVDAALWINIESPTGRAIVEEVCRRNEGLLGLLLACQKHASSHAAEVVQHLQGKSHLQVPMGPLKRQHVRGLLK